MSTMSNLIASTLSHTFRILSLETEWLDFDFFGLAK